MIPYSLPTLKNFNMTLILLIMRHYNNKKMVSISGKP